MPTRVKPGARWIIAGVASAVAIGIAVMIFAIPAYKRWRDPWPRLESVLAEVEPGPSSFSEVFTERHGSKCLTQGCDTPRLERVYLTELTPERACDVMLAELKSVRDLADRKTTRTPQFDPDTDEFACYVEARLDGKYLTIQVDESYDRFPRHGVPPGNTFLAVNVFD